MKCLDGSNNVKVYNLTADKNRPDWMNKKKKKKESKGEDDALIQDFQMPDVSTCVKLSPDGQYLMVTGTYKPVLKCYDLSELSVKFERGMDAEVIRIEVLGEDYSKLAFLQDGRYIELHGQNGKVDRLRVPRFGRDMCYHSPSSDLFVATSGNEMYRLNVAQGRFLNAVVTNASGINRLLCNPYLNLMSWCTDDGVLQYWDHRVRTTVATLNVSKHVMEYAHSNSIDISSRKDLRLTSMASNGAFTVGIGTQTGQILMYDIRSNSPYLIRDHHTKAPIDELHFHSSGNVFSMAPGNVKIWDKNSGEAVTSIEGDSVFNDMEVVPGTGLVFLAAEHRKMKAYFIPSLGPAPSWCAHLDAMTEEMETDETSTVASQYDDYTFVSPNDVIEMGLTELIGTSMLRAAMHGYYINTATYIKYKKIANPVKPQNVLRKKIKATIAEENTIQLKHKNDTKFNSGFAKKLPSEKQNLLPALQDSRFASLHNDTEFRIDDTMAHRIPKFTNLSDSKKKQSDHYRKRVQEIRREEKELEDEIKETAVESDVDSIADEFGANDSEPDTDDSEERENMRKLFKKGGKRQRI